MFRIHKHTVIWLGGIKLAHGNKVATQMTLSDYLGLYQWAQCNHKDP